jgi:hypothetical protein
MAEAHDEESRSRDEAASSGPGAADSSQDQGGQGAESYGGDPDTGPSVTEDEVERGLERDQAEG